MNKHTNIKGVVFRMHGSKEADKVVHLLTEEGERQVVVAKGVLKPTSRKAHAIDLLNHVEVKLVGAGQMQVIAEVKLLSSHPQFKIGYTALLFIQFICEIVHLFAQEDQIEPGLYNNLINMLSVAKPERLGLLSAALILRYLQLSGGLPRLQQDVITEAALQPDSNIYPTAEIGYTTRQELALGEAIPLEIFKTQRFILQHDFQTIQRISLSRPMQLIMLSLHIRWLEIFTDYRLRSATIFLTNLQK